jgi:hypothetical protein
MRDLGFNGRVEPTAISAGLATRDYFGDTAHRPNIVWDQNSLCTRQLMMVRAGRAIMAGGQVP